MASVFYAYRDSPQRRRALAAAPGSPERYLLFGLDQLVERGWSARHDLERAGGETPAWARASGAVLKAGLERAGGYGGDFATVLASLQTANRADVVLSTVDTVGIPLLLLGRAGRVRPPLVYIAIGLPERIARLRSERMRRLYARALAGTAAVTAYSAHEADELRAFMAAYGFETGVEFVPFGVDEEAFVPTAEHSSDDVVMAGADPHRDVDLFAGLAAEMPSRSFRLVTTEERARDVSSPPPNLAVEADIRFDDMKRRLESARVVALPVLDNSYSGATTVLLQAMALGKPIVVTRTKAIATGYGLVDGENCRLVEPGDADGFGSALAGVLRDEWHARSLGARARRTVEAQLTWRRYVDRIEELLRDACAPVGPQRDRREEA